MIEGVLRVQNIAHGQSVLSFVGECDQAGIGNNFASSNLISQTIFASVKDILLEVKQMFNCPNVIDERILTKFIANEIPNAPLRLHKKELSLRK